MGNKLGLKSNFKNSQTQHTGALTFKKGENLEVSDLNDPDRWKVRRSETGEIGNIPVNYVGTTVIESEEVPDEIDRKDLKLLRRLERGIFGTVFYGTLMDQTYVAVKRLNPGTMSPKAFLDQAVIIRRCRHDNLVQLYGVCARKEPLLIVTEFLPKGSLLDYLRDDPEGKSLKLPALIDICAQVASGMSYLESINMVHRDLGAKNVLMGHNNVVKVADFGWLGLVIEDIGGKYPVCALKYTAPEAVLYGQFTIKSDVWSYGIVLYEVITLGGIPYPGMTFRDMREQVWTHKYRLLKPLWGECPDSYYNTMLKCWHEVPENRPTFEYLCHYFEDYFVDTERQYLKADDNE